MATLPNQNVVDFLANIQSNSLEQYQIALQVRELHLNFAPDLVEEIKYGGLVFFKGKDLLGGIFFYKKHISIEFSYGVSLSDPHSVLEGKGNLRRHIKIRSAQEIEIKNISQYIKEALTAKSPYCT